MHRQLTQAVFHRYFGVGLANFALGCDIYTNPRSLDHFKGPFANKVNIEGTAQASG